MNRARGMSLLELLMVLVLVATLAGIGATVIGRQLPGRELHDAARTVAGELRFARARAIATGGRIVIKRGEAAWRVDVAWLTGEVTLSRGEGPA